MIKLETFFFLSFFFSFLRNHCKNILACLHSFTSIFYTKFKYEIWQWKKKWKKLKFYVLSALDICKEREWERERETRYLLLTAHNWQKWKSTFLTCHCHEIYREEAVGLKSSNYTWKIMIFCENVKCGAISLKIGILYFVNNCLIKVQILTFFCTYVIHTIVSIWRTPHFVSTPSIFS